MTVSPRNLAATAAAYDAIAARYAQFVQRELTAYRWPVGDLSALATEAGFAEVGRMSREPRDGEPFRRGHLLLRAAA